MNVLIRAAMQCVLMALWALSGDAEGPQMSLITGLVVGGLTAAGTVGASAISANNAPDPGDPDDDMMRIIHQNNRRATRSLKGARAETTDAERRRSLLLGRLGSAQQLDPDTRFNRDIWPKRPMDRKGGGALGNRTYRNIVARPVGRVLDSPTGMLVGRAIEDARGLLDADSETSRSFIRNLTEKPLEAIEARRLNSERGLSAEMRGAQSEVRDLGLGRGAARASNAERAIMGRSAERFGAMRSELATETAAKEAEVLGKASQFFETFRRAWAQDAVNIANAFVNNAPWIRDAFTGQMATIASNIANVWTGAAAQATQITGQQQQIAGRAALDQQQFQNSLVGAGMELATTAITSSIGSGGGGASNVNVFNTDYGTNLPNSPDLY